MKSEVDRILAIWNKGVLPIYGVAHLSWMLDVSPSSLSTLLGSERAVRSDLRRRGSRPRAIYIPDSEYLAILRKINQLVFLPADERLDLAAFGFRPGCSPSDCMDKHKHGKWMLKLDIHEFFSSISFFDVKRTFIRVGHSETVSETLAEICTINENGRRVLPTGFPTSPYISNWVLASFDKRMRAWCAENKIYYTRYVDDLFFSGTEAAPNNIIGSIQGLVDYRLGLHGLTLNLKKTRFYRGDSVFKGLGVELHPSRDELVGAGRYMLPSRRMRAHIENQTRCIKKFGVETASRHCSETSGIDRGLGIPEYRYVQHLAGALSYIKNINKAYGNDLENELQIALGESVSSYLLGHQSIFPNSVYSSSYDVPSARKFGSN